MRIAYFTRDDGGCTFYRASQPLDTLYDLKLADVMRVDKGDNADRAADAFAGCDVAMFPRLAATDSISGLMKSLKEDRKLIVIDYDDNVFGVTPLSPHYSDYGLEEYQHELNGQMIDVWKDGRDGFCIKGNREKLELIKRSLGNADLVTTTTEILADVLREFNPNVVALPNCVDLDRWKKPDLKPHDDCRIFWAGGSSHYEDWMLLQEVMPAVMQRFPRVRLVLMGVKFAGSVKYLPQDRIDFVPWEDVHAYPLRCSMIDADISIIPLIDNTFNRCKSAIKWIEQSALGIPSVVSYVSPYKEIYNGENAAMVRDNNKDAWIEAISALVKDPIMRAKMGGEAQRYVREHFDIKKRAVDWLKAYQAAMPEPRKAAA